MIGGEPETVQRLDPLFRALAPSAGAAPRTPGREGDPGAGEQGYLHCGPSGAGHFVKMVHNGIEYGIMAAYAEGFNILRHADAGGLHREKDAETAPLRNPEHYRYEFRLEDIAEVWRRGSVISSWLLDLRPRPCTRIPASSGSRGASPTPGGALDHPRGHRRVRSRAGPHDRPLPEVFVAGRIGFRGPRPFRHAVRLRRTYREEEMSAAPSDALVFFGATGDLAYKKIFPALQRMIRHGRLDVPVIGISKAGWGVEQLRNRAAESLERHGGGIDPEAFGKLTRLLRYVDGDYLDPRTFEALRREMGAAQAAGPLSRHPAGPLRRRRRAAEAVRGAPTARA